MNVRARLVMPLLGAAFFASGCASAGYWLVSEGGGAPLTQTRDGVTVTVSPARSPAAFRVRIENGGTGPARVTEPFAWLAETESRDPQPNTVSASTGAAIGSGQAWDGGAQFAAPRGTEGGLVLTVLVAQDVGDPIRFFFRYRVVQREGEPRHAAADAL